MPSEAIRATLLRIPPVCSRKSRRRSHNSKDCLFIGASHWPLSAPLLSFLPIICLVEKLEEKRHRVLFNLGGAGPMGRWSREVIVVWDLFLAGSRVSFSGREPTMIRCVARGPHLGLCSPHGRSLPPFSSEGGVQCNGAEAEAGDGF